MDKVVYILGAGFSHPLGIPLSSTFIDRAQELRRSLSELRTSLDPVLDMIGELASVKHHFYSDQRNLEECLSILQMHHELRDLPMGDAPTAFVRTVIDASMKRIPKYNGGKPGNFEVAVFGSNTVWARYLAFMACLSNLRYDIGRNDPKSALRMSRMDSLQVEYSVITLNYDLVMEHAAAYLEFVPSTWVAGGEWAENGVPATASPRFPFVKLHGSIDGDGIVLPTWNKSISAVARVAWQRAHKLISEATHLRFIGYSLPTSDTYVRYLLKAALGKGTYVNQVDVLVYDPDDSVRARYEDFVNNEILRFRNGKVDDLLDPLRHSLGTNNGPNGLEMACDKLESAHKNTFAR